MEKEIETVKVTLKGELLKKFRRIKRELGVSANAEVVRALITKFSQEGAK